jgi:HlyD family secretion protein
VSDRFNQQLLKLTLLLQLERRARQALPKELPYVFVNETAELIPYRQAVFWRKDIARVETVSGIVKPEPNSPYLLWLKSVLKTIEARQDSLELLPFTADDLPPELAKDWSEWLPQYGILIPLPSPMWNKYSLLLFREDGWNEAELHLITYLAEAYGHALAYADTKNNPHPWQERLKQKKNQLILAGILFLLLFFPVRQSVLAEAEVTPLKPNLVRAPLEGIVESFHVQPNETVRIGQKLFSLDKAELKSRLDVAREKTESAKTEYLQTTQQAMLDPTVKSKLAGLKSKWEQEAAEVDYVGTLLKRSEVLSTINGVAVFDDPNDWLGRPVKQGEKILAVADPNSVELEVRLPMEDLIELEPGSDVLFFSNISPNHPLEAKLNYFSYRASPTPADIMAYRLKARFTGDELPRLGYHGTAKVYGARKPFILWLLRKPIRTLRLWLTL